jgi:hypothetical protein
MIGIDHVGTLLCLVIDVCFTLYSLWEVIYYALPGYKCVITLEWIKNRTSSILFGDGSPEQTEKHTPIFICFRPFTSFPGPPPPLTADRATRTRIRMRTSRRTRMRKRMCTRTRIRMRTRSRTCTHTRMRTRTHTHYQGAAPAYPL